VSLAHVVCYEIPRRAFEAVAQKNRRNRVKAWGDEGGTRLGMTTERSK
jgi:hypothetical protein